METFAPPCDKCGGRCCDYVAIEIKTPRTKADYDHIRWYLVHENVRVFVDHDKKWHIQFLTRCRHKNRDNRCDIYQSRPRICSGHGNSEGECEYYSTPYNKYFVKATDFEEFLENKKIDWKYKNK